jgi:acetolactate synthase I/II/III large subunit
VKRTGAQIIWESLLREGVTDVFGYPGGAILPAYDAMLDYPIRHVLVRHEQGATHMADGYARASGRVGVAVATSGPGATNMVTGIATAMLDSSPIVCICGQVGSRLIGTDAFQEVDITGITLPITKHNYLVTRVEEIAQTIPEAFEIARSGRPGPVLVDITKDAQQASCDFDSGAAVRRNSVSPSDVARQNEGDCRRAADLINAARRPVILAGQGILHSGATTLVRALAERADIPVAMTLLGIGTVPASHPLNLGMMGMHGEAWVNTAIQESDLLVALGMRFDDRVTGEPGTYAPHARIVHVDIDAAEIGKNVRVDVGLVGDLCMVLERLLPAVVPGNRSEWLRHISSMKDDSGRRAPAVGRGDRTLLAAQVIEDSWRATKGRALVVTDVGQNQMWTARHYRLESPRSLITSGGLGTMGFALPAAIGAKVARPDAEVWAIAGDGGFQMTMAELATLAQEKLDVKVAILNNGFLGMVRQWQELFYGRRYAATPLLGPDFVRLAAAFGLRAMSVRTRAEVLPAVEAARAHTGSVVIDFVVEKEDSVYPMVPAGSSLGEMIRRPTK